MINTPQPHQVQYDPLQAALASFGIYPHSMLLNPFLGGNLPNQAPVVVNKQAFDLPQGIDSAVLLALLKQITGQDFTQGGMRFAARPAPLPPLPGGFPGEANYGFPNTGE